MNNNINVEKFDEQVMIDFPHKLKSHQLKALGEVVSTIGKYEHELYYLSIVCRKLFEEFITQGQVPDSEIAKLYLSVRDIYHALLPCYPEGTFDRHNGLQGKWDDEKKCHSRYI